MSNDLQQLLKRADELSPPPLATDNLAHRVTKVRARRRAIRTIATVVILASGFTMTIPLTRPRPKVVVAPSNALEEITSLLMDAQLHSMTAEKLASAKTPAPSGNFTDTQLERDRAALMLVYDAQQHEQANQRAQ